MKRVRRNTLILFVNNAGGAALAFAISVLIGRALGPAGLGDFRFITAWIAPLTLLADFGLGTLLTRDVARDPASAPHLLRLANRTLPFIAGAVLVTVWALLPFTALAPPIIAGLALAALLIVLDPWYGLYTALFRAFERMTPILVVNVGGLVVQLILTGIALAGGAGILGGIGALVVVNVVQLGLIWGWWQRAKIAPTSALADKPTSGAEVRSLLRRAAPFTLAAVIGALNVRLNIFLLEHLAGDVAVGLYSAAGRFVDAGQQLPNAFFGAVFPALSALATRPVDLMRLFRRAALFLGGLSVILAVVLTLSGSLLLRLTYRDPFVVATPILTVLAWSLPLIVLHGLVNVTYYSIGREGLVNRVSLLALVAQAGVGWLCITTFGGVGAALASILVESGALVVLLMLLRIEPYRSASQPVRR